MMLDMVNDEDVVLQRVAWLISYLERHGSPTDPPASRKPLTKAEIGRRLGRDGADVSKLRNPDSAGRKSVGAGIVRQMARGFGISPLIFTDEIQGEPNITLYILKEKRQGRAIETVDSKVDALAARIDKLVTIISDQQREIEELKHGHHPHSRLPKKAQ